MAVQAAEGEVVKLKELIRVRGCKEEFIADPALLQEGKVSCSSTGGLPNPAETQLCIGQAPP